MTTRPGQGVGPLKNAQNFICTNYKPWTPALTWLSEEMVIFKCFIAASQSRATLGAACCKMLNINKILLNIFFCTKLCQRLWNKCFLYHRERKTGCGGTYINISISGYFKLDRNILLRLAQSHFPGLDVWSVRTSIELTPN